MLRRRKLVEGGDAGFGDVFNAGVTALKGYSGTVYAGTARFRLNLQVADPSHAVANPESQVCQLRIRTGNLWTLLSQNGFTDTCNVCVSDMGVHKGKLVSGPRTGV